MIDTKAEKFTAAAAIDAGLIDAVKRGETNVEGSYSLTANGIVKFRQKKFVFTDNSGNLRAGTFTGKMELLDFWDKFCTAMGETM